MKLAEDMILGQLRQVIASMKIDEINKDRDTFLSKIQTSLEPELKKIGLVLINVNIKDISDESGYIEAIGKKAASEAIQQATIDVAHQEKLGAIGVASAANATARSRWPTTRSCATSAPRTPSASAPCAWPSWRRSARSASRRRASSARPRCARPSA